MGNFLNLAEAIDSGAEELGSEPLNLRGRVACVDLETTGGAAPYHHVIEVGVVLLDGGVPVEEWSSLVNPGCSIPPSIAAFTGIDDAMVADAPRFEDLSADIRRRLDGRLFVAHNARFDHGFLRREFRRIGERFDSPALCTVRLSRSLFPEERGHNLDALIARHGLSCEARHRALGDARVLPALLAAFERRVGRLRLHEAVESQLHATRLPPGLADLADALPEVPGVYILRAEDNSPVYVGKARNLRSQVLAQLSADNRDALIRQVRNVEWFETGGELGAWLLEARLIRDLAPPENRRLRPMLATSVIRLDATDHGTAVRIEPIDAAAAAEETELYGPFKSEQAARRALEARARDAGLCLKLLGFESGEGSCVARQLGRCRGGCLGLEPRALHDTRLKLALAPLRLRSWPFPGPLAIREQTAGSGDVLHVIDRWHHLGSAASEEELQALTARPADPSFDAETYRIVTRWLRRVDARACIPLPRRGPDA